MSKSTGLGDQLFFDGYDIGADINSISSIATPRATLPFTAITQSAMAREYGERDGSAEFTSYLNPEAARAHDALSPLPTSDVHVMYLRGQSLGGAAIGMIGKQIDYAPNRGDDGSLLISSSVQANGFGLDWGLQLTTGKQTDASATDSASIDTGASASFGFQAYLQVFSIGSGSADIVIEDSADDSNFAEINNGASFTSVSGRTAERIQSASDTETVRRYIRVSTTGTFTDLVFAVIINKNKNVRAI